MRIIGGNVTVRQFDGQMIFVDIAKFEKARLTIENLDIIVNANIKSKAKKDGRSGKNVR